MSDLFVQWIQTARNRNTEGPRAAHLGVSRAFCSDLAAQGEASRRSAVGHLPSCPLPILFTGVWFFNMFTGTKIPGRVSMMEAGRGLLPCLCVHRSRQAECGGGGGGLSTRALAEAEPLTQASLRPSALLSTCHMKTQSGFISEPGREAPRGLSTQLSVADLFF